MTREDIIRMAKEAGNQELLKELYVYRASEYLKDVTAALKKKAEGK